MPPVKLLIFCLLLTTPVQARDCLDIREDAPEQWFQKLQESVASFFAPEAVPSSLDEETAEEMLDFLAREGFDTGAEEISTGKLFGAGGTLALATVLTTGLQRTPLSKALYGVPGGVLSLLLLGIGISRLIEGGDCEMPTTLRY